jgi:hypothetical protein
VKFESGSRTRPETDASLAEKLRAVGNFVSQTAAMIPPPASGVQVSLNSSQVALSPDGSWTVYVSSDLRRDR